MATTTTDPSSRHPDTTDTTQCDSSSSRSSTVDVPLVPTMSYDINLPNRILSNTANLDEYVVETRDGQIPGPIEPDGERRYRLVTFQPGDPENPKNWSKAFKWYITMVVAATCFVVAFASSVVTPDIGGVAEEFEVSEEVALLSITLFVVGFGIGPLAFAPLSEVYGRQVIYVSTLFVAVVFIIPCALAKNIATLLVGRAIDGIAFSAPITIIGGTLADLWKAEERGIPMAAFSAAPFIGPAVGPLVGGFLSDALGWRWLYWLTLILSGVIWVLITFTIPETYAPTILARRAKKLRKETGEQDWVTEQDLDMRPLAERIRIFLIMPLKLLFGELIVFLISLYMSVLYGLLYMFFIAFPIVFSEGKGYSAGITGLTFIPLALGVVGSALCAPFVNKHYVKIIAPYAGRMPPAELRLIPMMFACWFIPLGLIIFAWTSYPRLIWVGPTLAGFPVGFGFIFIYNSANNYLVDTYQDRAASALASKTFIRSLWGASVVLFTRQMYHNLGYQWATFIIFGISLACCAIPFLFWKFGERIRQRSKYAYAGDDANEKAAGVFVPEKKGGSNV
ncbi:major facilitator superfamily domain-containing protein [Xylaria bambusicola]|uniref:major facilitator superfamily domain-containing protein n=1 Tax=Xylaria bambusicola TaxID=326684 RepID=UPI0020083404|nr:major facilitator superfamily domain-containing protein [Xylaria bambusicola]KAI0513247.1 major facilitator superfamily domain-containing protein [Xylaria bambusicola]